MDSISPHPFNSALGFAARSHRPLAFLCAEGGTGPGRPNQRAPAVSKLPRSPAFHPDSLPSQLATLRRLSRSPLIPVFLRSPTPAACCGEDREQNYLRHRYFDPFAGFPDALLKVCTKPRGAARFKVSTLYWGHLNFQSGNPVLVARSPGSLP